MSDTLRRLEWSPEGLQLALLGPGVMSDLSPHSGAKRTLIDRSHLAVYECSAYIPDMSSEDSERARHRKRQARYEARLRDGVALYPVPLGAAELDALVALGWLPDCVVLDRDRVGEALASAFREMARAKIS